LHSGSPVLRLPALVELTTLALGLGALTPVELIERGPSASAELLPLDLCAGTSADVALIGSDLAAESPGPLRGRGKVAPALRPLTSGLRYALRAVSLGVSCVSAAARGTVAMRAGLTLSMYTSITAVVDATASSVAERLAIATPGVVRGSISGVALGPSLRTKAPMPRRIGFTEPPSEAIRAALVGFLSLLESPTSLLCIALRSGAIGLLPGLFGARIGARLRLGQARR
jgi:hypothetical protein